MKIIKIIFVFVLIIFITGCKKVEYNIIQSNNGTTTEIISMTILNSSIKENGKNLKEVIEQKKQDFSLISNLYPYTLNEGEQESIITFKRNYDSMCDVFLKSKVINNIYEYIGCSSEDGYYKYYSYGDYIPLNFNQQYGADKLVVKITTPYKVLKNNADEVNGNTYTWIYDNNTPLDKSFYMEVSNNKTSVNGKIDNVKKQIKKNKNYILGLIFVFALFFVAALFIYLFYKKYVNKEKEY